MIPAIETLDRRMREQLRSRGRKLPVMLPSVMGGPVMEAPKRGRPIVVSARPISNDKRVCQVNPFAQIKRLDPATLYEQAIPTAAEAAVFLSMRELVKLVSSLSGISVGDLLSHRRARPISRARMVIMWLAKKHSRFTMPFIGRHLGDRDHTSVMHGQRMTERLLNEGEVYVSTLVNRAEATIFLKNPH